MSGHSRGPWEVKSHDGVTAISGPDEWIAVMDADDEETDKANAQMIVASLDMLDALKLARKAMQINDWDDKDNSPSHCRQAFYAVTAAIAKAEGRE